jgi:arsenate reductase (glutaredoxin)
VGLQLFGTRKCPETRKAERFLKERGIPYQFIDLTDKGISLGELKSVAAALAAAGLGRAELAAALIDESSRRYGERGLAYMDFDLEAEILADPLLLRTPILRDGRKAAVGFDPEAWKHMLGGK